MSGGYIDPYGFSKGSGGGGSSGGGGGSKGYIDPYGFSNTPKGAKPQAQHHGGGGFFGKVGGFFSHIGSDAGSAISGIPTGVEMLGKAAVHDSAKLSGAASHALHLSTSPSTERAGRGGYELPRIGGQIAHQYKQEYSPLVHGQFGKFGHEFYQHPLGPILDALTVATLGAGGVGKAGEIASDAGLISKESKLANLRVPTDLTTKGFDGQDVLVKQSSHAPLVRWRQQLTNHLLNKLPPETPGLGSTARAVRALSRGPAKEAARLDIQARDFNAAFQKLSKPEMAAWHLKARGLTPDSYRAFLQEHEPDAPMLKTLADPKVHEAFENPSPKLQQALSLGRDLSDRLTASRVSAGHMDELTAAESPYRHLRLVNGAKFEPVTEESPALVAAKAERDRLAGLHEKALQADEAWLKGAQNRDLGALSPEDAQARLARLDKEYEAVVQRTIPHVSPYGGDLSREEQLRRNFTAGKTGKRPLSVSEEERQLADQRIREVVANHAEDPAAQAMAKMLAERDSLRAALNARGEAGLFGHEAEPLPSAPAAEHASVPLESNPHRDTVVTLGHRLEAAQAAVDHLAGRTGQTGDVRLVDQPGRDIATLARELHDAGLEQPFHVPDSAHAQGIRSRFSSKPSGYAAPASGVKQSRLVLASKGLINPYENILRKDFARYRNQAQAQLLHDELVKHAAILPHGEPIPPSWEELKLNRGQAAAPYTTRVAAKLAHEIEPRSLLERLRRTGQLADVPEGEGQRLIVPSQVQRLLEDESRSHLSRAMQLRQNALLAPWKALVLGLRPAFFGNITIGNSVLGMLQMAPGRFGVLGWLNQVLPGFDKVAGTPLTEATMREVFPEQVTGTFGESVKSHFGTSKVGRIAERASAGVMPATIRYENVLRRAMAEGWARATPQVQHVLEQNGGDLNAALHEIAKTHPQIIDGISRRVDNALGNYRTYNKFERAIKSVVPFYGWNRHITSSLFRLASERPQTLDALLNTGLQGKAKADHIIAGISSYLNQSIPVHLPAALGGQKGSGIVTVLDPHSWNPFSTVTDEGKMLALPFNHAGVSSDAFPIAPDLQALIEQLTGKSLLTGAPIKGNAIKDELENLVPQESLFTSKHPHSPNSVNQNHTWAQLLRILGLPVENVNMPAARQKWRTLNIPVK